MKTTLKDTAKQIAFIAACATLAAIFAGCSATKINFEKTSDGTTKYSIWHNDHWLKTEAESLTGGMSQDGEFSLGMTGLKSSPSEEFNRTMQTYTAAVVSMMQIAAAAYNPSASRVVSGGVVSGGVENSSLTHSPTPNSPTPNSPTPNSPTTNSPTAADAPAELKAKISEYFVSRGGNANAAKIYYDAANVLTMSDGTTTVECTADGACRECGDK